MKLVERTIEDFTGLLASDAPAPGGGSTAALQGALGAALIHMVGALTTGKAKYAEHQPMLDKLLVKSEDIKNRFMEIIDADTEAFNGVTAAYARPKGTDQEKAARKAAIEEALKACTRTPLTMMSLALEALELAAEAAGKTNPNAASDFGVAALSLKAAVQGAWLNILINLGGLKDQAFRVKYRGEGELLLTRSQNLADQLYRQVEQDLRADGPGA